MKAMAVHIELSAAPAGLAPAHDVLLTEPAQRFVADLVTHFDGRVQQMLRARRERQLRMDASGELPDFLAETAGVREDTSWRVAPLPGRLACRHVDLGDVSPADESHFRAALNSPAQGVQTDFDDGHCPTWSNQLRGLYNVYRAVHGQLQGVPAVRDAPVLMLRPRAWNMEEHNMLVNGKVVPGPLFDFGLLMFHVGCELFRAHSGPYFYLSKLEGHLEARLWNDIFLWTQQKLGLAAGSIRACVLIENVLASFEMEEILYELREHSAGLNAGMWDYSASFVNKFGARPEFVLPDRSKYVSMERRFLRSYLATMLAACRRRAAPATGGMAARVLSDNPDRDSVQAIVRSKAGEVAAGVDGFMVYDARLVLPMQRLFSARAPSGPPPPVTQHDLLAMPKGGVTRAGLQHNIAVSLLFIAAWLRGKGHYLYKGAVEDSATAEISRSQVWQWVRHGARLEDDGGLVSAALVRQMTREFDAAPVVKALFLQLALAADFPPFVTSYLYDRLPLATAATAAGEARARL